VLETLAVAASKQTQTSLMFGIVEPEGLQTLEAMGFTRDAAKAALTAHNGDVAAAAAQLSQPSVEDKCRTIAARLAKADAAAAGEVAALLARIAANPRDQRHTIILLGGAAPLQTALRAGQNAGVELLVEAGYRRHDATTLALTRADPARLYAAKSALDAARTSSPGRQGRNKALQAQASREARAAAAKSFASVQEPRGGAVLTFADGSGAKFATRRFDGDDTLDRVVRFLATCEVGCPPDGDGWRVVAETTPPSFWCDGWVLSDKTTRDEQTFAVKDASKTLQSLQLWPSATLVVESADDDVVLTKPQRVRPPSPTKGHRLGPKPKPSDLFKRVTARHDPRDLSGADKPRGKVAVSADKVPGLGRLLAMGFPEAKARDALRRAHGDVNAAVAALL